MVEISDTEPSENCGHVFVLHCDSEGLAADALLVANVSSVSCGVRDAGLREGKTRVYETCEPPSDLSDKEALNVIVKAVTDYLKLASETVTESVYLRQKPLFAFPLFSAGKTDLTDKVLNEGDYIAKLLPLAYQSANKYGVDIAVCSLSYTAFNVMQVRREDLCPFKSGPFWMLSDSVRQDAQRIAHKAIIGSLSVFFGAGVSFCSGLPSWGGLLQDLAKVAGFSEEEQKELTKLNYLDQPTLIEERIGRDKLRPAVAKITNGGCFTPVHSILAELHVPCATTNYDALLERASTDKIERLPWSSFLVSERDTTSQYARFVTKIHGCVSHPQSIVLTRRDYLRYGSRRQALRGIIHNMLLTSHILFIGFSMTDDNLHLIIDEARKCLETKKGGDPEGEFGTILTLVHNRMFNGLWDQDFSVTSFGKSYDDKPAWMHDCYLDCAGHIVAKHRAMSSFVLDPKFEPLLTTDEKLIKKSLQDVVELADNQSVRDSPAWPIVEDLLKRLGAGSIKNLGNQG